MKSKKIVALIVAFAAFMAVATSGLAASTTTTYLGDKVSVTAEFTAQAGKEVTYLVKNSKTEIVYIDQKTAGNDGNVKFEYKIAKDKIADLETTVQLGTDGTAIADAVLAEKELEFDEVTVVKDEGVENVKFYADEDCTTLVTDLNLGNADKLYAVVEVKEATHELESVSINGAAQEVAAVYEVAMGQTITVVTKEKVVKPSVTPDKTTIDSIIPEGDADIVNPEVYEIKNIAMKITGNPSVVGVVVGEGEDAVLYKALPGASGVYEEGVIYAVRIITEKGEEITDYKLVCE